MISMKQWAAMGAVVVVAGAGLYFFTREGTVAPVQDKDATAEYSPSIDPKNFSANVTNPFFALPPGKKTVYEAKKDEGTERIEFYVTNDRKTVMGVETVVIWDRAWLDGVLIEETRDWFAQDKDGNVWYFGEETAEWEDGKIVSTYGSWEAGVDGAKPGIIMEANPKVGDSYREEYYAGEAEDRADVLSVSESVVVPFGSFKNCLKTKNYTHLQPDVVENKYYCKEVGNSALEIDLDSGERAELVSVEYNAKPSPNETAQASPAGTKIVPEKTAALAPAPAQPSPTPPGNPMTPKDEVTEAQAKAIALQRVPGTVTDVAVETKNGKQVYVVEIMASSGGETDVLVDMSTGTIVGVE